MFSSHQFLSARLVLRHVISLVRSVNARPALVLVAL